MSYTFYKWLHLSSLFIMTASTGLLLSSAFGATYVEKTRKNLAKVHGFALLTVLIAGFGLLAKLKLGGSTYVSLWFWVKILAWFLFGMLPVVIRKTPDSQKPKLLLLYSFLPALVIYLVLNKV